MLLNIGCNEWVNNMKQQLNRDWLERYKTNPRENKTVYKNYANPTNAYGASRAQEVIEQGILKGYPVGEQETLQQMMSTLPLEMRGLPPQELINRIRNNYEFNKGFGEQLEGMRSQNENRFNQMQTAHTQKMEQLRAQATPLAAQQQRERATSDWNKAIEGVKSAVNPLADIKWGADYFGSQLGRNYKSMYPGGNNARGAVNLYDASTGQTLSFPNVTAAHPTYQRLHQEYNKYLSQAIDRMNHPHHGARGSRSYYSQRYGFV